MWIITFFTESGIPKTGLAPVLKAIDISDNSVILNNVLMTEISNGFYKYNFNTYNDLKDYIMLSDGGVTLDNTERYVSSSNNLSSDINELDRFNKSSMVITGTDMEAYDDDGTLQTWDLENEDGVASNLDIFKRLKK